MAMSTPRASSRRLTCVTVIIAVCTTECRDQDPGARESGARPMQLITPGALLPWAAVPFYSGCASALVPGAVPVILAAHKPQNQHVM